MEKLRNMTAVAKHTSPARRVLRRGMDTLSSARRLEAAGFTREQAETLATENANLFVEHAATVSDVESARLDLSGKIGASDTKLSGKIETVHTELSGKIETVHTELSGKIEAVHTELSGKIEAVRTELSGKIETVYAELSGKIEAVDRKLDHATATLRAEIRNMGQSLLIKTGIMQAASIGIVAALVKLL